MSDIFKQYEELLIPEKIKEIDAEMKKLSNDTNVSEKYDNIFNAFEQAKKINLLVKHKMTIKQKEFTEKYEAINSNHKKIYYITNLTPELQTNMNKWFLVSRTRDKFGAKINVVIDTNSYGTEMRFPALTYYSPREFNPLDCRDTKEIKLQMFRIQYVDRIKECVEQHKKMVTPYIEQMNKFFEEVKVENSKYFVLNKI